MDRSQAVGALPAGTCAPAGSSGITGTFAKGTEVPAAIPELEVRYPCIPHPFATNVELSYPKSTSVRLACLSHAASVRSEPGSNSSVKSLRPDARIINPDDWI